MEYGIYPSPLHSSLAGSFGVLSGAGIVGLLQGMFLVWETLEEGAKGWDMVMMDAAGGEGIHRV